MSIDGHKEIEIHEPALPGFTVQVVRFAPSRECGLRQSVSTVPALRFLLAPYRDHERLIVYLDRDGGDSGSVWVHRSGDRNWVTHFVEPGGVDSYCRDPTYCGPDQMFGFLLSNGQLDDIHRHWTVSSVEGMRALEHFLLRGERDPGLSWVAEPQSLQEVI